MRVYPKETLAQDDEAGDVKNSIGGEVVQLHAIGVHQTTNKFVNREGESPVHEVDEADVLHLE